MISRLSPKVRSWIAEKLLHLFKINLGYGDHTVEILGKTFWVTRRWGDDATYRVYTEEEIQGTSEAVAKATLAKFPRQTPEGDWPLTLDQALAALGAPTTPQEAIYLWELQAGFHTPGTPEHIDPEVVKLRLSFIQEEFDELREAVENDDLVGIADALGDLVWVCYGAARAWGIDLDAVLREITRSNFTKLEDDQSKYGRGMKVGKGPSYEPPQLDEVLSNQEPIP